VDGQTNMAKLMGAFFKSLIANAPKKNHILCGRKLISLYNKNIIMLLEIVVIQSISSRWLCKEYNNMVGKVYSLEYTEIPVCSNNNSGSCRLHSS
jgi:hypothetical protein